MPSKHGGAGGGGGEARPEKDNGQRERDAPIQWRRGTTEDGGGDDAISKGMPSMLARGFSSGEGPKDAARGSEENTPKNSTVSVIFREPIPS